MHEEVGHLVAVPHLLAIHPRQRPEVVVGRRRVVQLALLFDRRELGVALDGDEVLARVADALVRDLQHGLPLVLAFEVPEFDLRVRLAEERLEAVLPDVVADHADLALPRLEVVGPVGPGRDLDGHLISP